MKRNIRLLIIILIIGMLSMSASECDNNNESKKEQQSVERQQSQYAKGQPVPAFNWSLERHLMIELYNLRNRKVATHAVWRGDYSIVEGDCPSLGYGLPYDTSLTNPLQMVGHRLNAVTSIEQPEPNGIFASKNTSATWVMCVGEAGSIEPIYVESKVTIYPGPVKVDYVTNRVERFGKATVQISKD